MTDEFNWNAWDFIVATTLLGGSGVLYQFITSKSNYNHKLFLILIVMLVVIIWMDLAIGIIGTPFSGN